MKYRKLRIAWSVVWGIACLLLVVLWVRSYWFWDSAGVKLHANRGIIFTSLRGQLTFESGFELDTFQGLWKRISLYIRQEPDGGILGTSDDGIPFTHLNRDELTVGFGTTPTAVFMPHWLSAVVFFALAAAPWIRGRYSLLTLLIAVTVAAIGLGIVVYLVR